MFFLFLFILTIPLAAQPLSCDTSACGTGINGFDEQQCRAKLVLICKGYTPSSLPTIELQVQPTSELIYLSVGDLPPVSLQPRHMGKPLDISHMFVNGLEKLRVQAFTEKEWQQYSLTFTVRYNGQQIYAVSCNPHSCDPLGEVSRQDNKVGPFFDRIFDIQVNSPVQHEQYSLGFSGLGSGLKSAVYINDQYTGRSVAQAGNLRLPPSEYRIGVGVSSEQEVPYGSFQGATRYLVQYTGNYYEQRVQGAGDLQNFASFQPLPIQNVVRIGIVPIQTMNDGQQTYMLTQNDINRLSAQINQTITRYVQPLSYGLQNWDVKFESMYTPLVNGANGEVDAEGFVRNYQPELLNKYDVIIVYYGNDNNRGAAAGNGFIHLPKGSVTHNASVTDNQGNFVEELPLEIFLHETNHVLEQNEREMLRQWKGFAGADSGSIFGYPDTRNDQRLWARPAFMSFYRDYMRGQVIASNDMSANSPFPATVDPNFYDPSEYRYVGVFGTLRNGIANLHSIDELATPAADTYRIYNAHFRRYLGENASPSVTAAAWTLEPYSEYVRLQNVLNDNQFLHLDEGRTGIVRSTSISGGSWSSHWVPIKVDGRILLKNRWTREYLAMTDANTLTVVTNAERQALQLDKLVWELIPNKILDRLSSGYFFIKSAWPNAAGHKVHVEFGAPATSVSPDGWLSSQWGFKVIDGKYVKITNRWQSNKSLHVENGYLEAGSALDGWHSAQWELEPVAGLDDAYRLKNRHRPDQYLNIENMILKSSSVPEHYWSSYWSINAVQSLSGLKLCEFNDPVAGTTPGCTATSVGGSVGGVAYRIEKFGVILLYVVVNNSPCMVSVSGNSPSYNVTGNCSNYSIRYN